MAQKRLVTILTGIFLVVLVIAGTYHFLTNKEPDTCEAEAVGGFAGIRNECRSESQCASKQGWSYDHCYLGVASYKRDLSLCNKITEPDAKNICIVNIAGLTKDKSLCNKINKDVLSGLSRYDDCQNGRIWGAEVPP